MSYALYTAYIIYIYVFYYLIYAYATTILLLYYIFSLLLFLVFGGLWDFDFGVVAQQRGE